MGLFTDLRYSSAFGWEKKQDEDLDNMLVSYCSSLGTTSTDKTHRFFQTGIQLKSERWMNLKELKKYWNSLWHTWNIVIITPKVIRKGILRQGIL